MLSTGGLCELEPVVAPEFEPCDGSALDGDVESCDTTTAEEQSAAWERLLESGGSSLRADGRQEHDEDDEDDNDTAFGDFDDDEDEDDDDDSLDDDFDDDDLDDDLDDVDAADEL